MRYSGQLITNDPGVRSVARYTVWYKWGWEMAPVNNQREAIGILESMLHAMEFERRRNEPGTGYRYWRWDDPHGTERPADDWMTDNLPGAAELVNRFMDYMQAKGRGRVQMTVYKLPNGTWEIMTPNGWQQDVWRQDGSIVKMERWEAARYITEAMGIIKWTPAQEGDWGRYMPYGLYGKGCDLWAKVSKEASND